jgi:hypothetical protein
MFMCKLFRFFLEGLRYAEPDALLHRDVRRSLRTFGHCISVLARSAAVMQRCFHSYNCGRKKGLGTKFQFLNVPFNLALNMNTNIHI